MRAVLQHISILDHAQNMTKGLIELKSIVYYCTFIFFALFMTHQVVEAQRI